MTSLLSNQHPKTDLWSVSVLRAKNNYSLQKIRQSLQKSWKLEDLFGMYLSRISRDQILNVPSHVQVSGYYYGLPPSRYNNPFIQVFFGKIASENLKQTGFFHKFEQQVNITKNCMDFGFWKLSSLAKPGIIMIHILKFICNEAIFNQDSSWG